MDICSLNWGAIAGFAGAIATVASPIIVAVYLYRKWHDQKGKEVIANEAKEILKIVEDLKNDYIYTYGNIDSLINHEKLFRREDLSKNRINSFINDRKYRDRVSLLLDIIEDNDIKEAQENIKEYGLQFTKQEMKTNNKSDLEILEQKLNLLVDSLNKLNLILIEYMMYKKEIIFSSKSA